MLPTQLLAFLRAVEPLKSTHRSAWTAAGQQESTAEHTWRLCLAAMLVGDAIPGIDTARLIRICLVHDLGETLSGDVPAPEQGADPGKSARERADLRTLVAPLPPEQQAQILALWEEYEAGVTPEARLAKGLDKLETILQHTQGTNPPGFDLLWNLEYGRKWTAEPALIADIRAILDRDTEARARTETSTTADA